MVVDSISWHRNEEGLERVWKGWSCHFCLMDWLALGKDELFKPWWVKVQANRCTEERTSQTRDVTQCTFTHKLCLWHFTYQCPLLYTKQKNDPHVLQVFVVTDSFHTPIICISVMLSPPITFLIQNCRWGLSDVTRFCMTSSIPMGHNFVRVFITERSLRHFIQVDSENWIEVSLKPIFPVILGTFDLESCNQTSLEVGFCHVWSHFYEIQKIERSPTRKRKAWSP